MSTQQKISGIYALLDPLTEEIRYIGCSADIHERWINHCKIQTCEKFRPTYLHKWLRSLSEKPKYILIEETLDLENREIFWIEYYRNLDYKLTNTTDGGEGVKGYKFSDQQRKMISERTKEGMQNLSQEKKDLMVKIRNQNFEKMKAASLVPLQDQYGKVYSSVKEAAEFFGFTPSNITYHLRANTPVKGFLLKRIQ